MNYYNDNDPAAAEWLRELVAERLIPDGDVDTRDIISVAASDLKGYTQCHFFAGIGGWSLALQLAGWPEDKPVWTGSCPCQPFSAAGKQLGTSDDRDLWPAFFRLIEKCQPEFIFGEQVENAIRHGWLDRVYADLEREEYAVGAAVLGAHSVGAPHRRYRLYWGGVRLAENTDGWGCGRGADGNQTGDIRKIQTQTQRLGNGIGMANPYEQGFQGRKSFERPDESFRSCSMEGVSPWRNSRFIFCRDEKARRAPSESVLFGLADGLPEGMDGSRVTGISETGGFPLTTQKEGRAMLLKGYGNAIVPQVAAEFIRAFIAQIEKGGQHEN